MDIDVAGNTTAVWCKSRYEHPNKKKEGATNYPVAQWGYVKIIVVSIR